MSNSFMLDFNVIIQPESVWLIARNIWKFDFRGLLPKSHLIHRAKFLILTWFELQLPNSPMINAIRLPNERKQNMSTYSRIRPKPPHLPIAIANCFNGFGNNAAFYNSVADNINLSIENLTQVNMSVFNLRIFQIIFQITSLLYYSWVRIQISSGMLVQFNRVLFYLL